MEISPRTKIEISQIIKLLMRLGILSAIVSFGCAYVAFRRGDRTVLGQLHDHEGESNVYPDDSFGGSERYKREVHGEPQDWISEGSPVTDRVTHQPIKSEGGQIAIHRHPPNHPIDGTCGPHEFSFERK